MWPRRPGQSGIENQTPTNKSALFKSPTSTHPSSFSTTTIAPFLPLPPPSSLLPSHPPPPPSTASCPSDCSVTPHYASTGSPRKTATRPWAARHRDLLTPPLLKRLLFVGRFSSTASRPYCIAEGFLPFSSTPRRRFWWGSTPLGRLPRLGLRSPTLFYSFTPLFVNGTGAGPRHWYRHALNATRPFATATALSAAANSSPTVVFPPPIDMSSADRTVHLMDILPPLLVNWTDSPSTLLVLKWMGTRRHRRPVRYRSLSG